MSKFEHQETTIIEKNELIKRARDLKNNGYRLVQISCTVLDHLQVDYTFDKEYTFYNLRIKLELENPQLPSISTIYLTAAFYENELHDLFGIQVEGMLIDFKGKFYRTAEKAPFLETSNINIVKDKKIEEKV